MVGASNGGVVLNHLADIDLVAPVNAPTIAYPHDLILWSRRVPEKEKVCIVNEGDFPMEDLLGSLGLADSNMRPSFGTSNYEELHGRSEIVALLLKSSRFREYILKESVPRNTLPTGEDEFLQFYDPSHGNHNPFWAAVHKFNEELDLATREIGTRSSRLETMKSVLISGKSLEEAERQVASIVKERIDQTSVIGGTITFHIRLKIDDRMRAADGNPVIDGIDLDVVEEKTHGYLRYSMALARLNEREKAQPDNFGEQLLKYTGLSSVRNGLRSLQRWREMRKAMRSTVLKTIPRELRQDITEWLQVHLRSLSRNNNVLKMLDGGQVRVGFGYDKEGLQVMVYSAVCSAQPSVSPPIPLINEERGGYNIKQRTAIRQARVAFENGWHETRYALHLSEFQRLLQEANSEFFARAVIPAPKTDRVCRWFAISNMYNSEPLKKATSACQKYRDFFTEHLARLREIAYLVRRVSDLAQSLNLPLCVAEPLSGDSHVVESDGIVPIHLLEGFKGRKKVVVPLTLPALNGRMICLTGKHGGGKTTALISMLAALYMAQSLTLAFGTRFRFNPKKALAALLIERGEGSTIELILKKVKNILETAERVPPNQMVAVIDELGSATQENAGDDFGRKVAKRLSDRGVSVIFATQIQSLARFAEEELNAHTCSLTRDHRVEAGISDGGLQELCESTGVAKLLD